MKGFIKEMRLLFFIVGFAGFSLKTFSAYLIEDGCYEVFNSRQGITSARV